MNVLGDSFGAAIVAHLSKDTVPQVYLPSKTRGGGDCCTPLKGYSSAGILTLKHNHNISENLLINICWKFLTFPKLNKEAFCIAGFGSKSAYWTALGLPDGPWVDINTKYHCFHIGMTFSN